jgi:hypothetical protein
MANRDPKNSEGSSSIAVVTICHNRGKRISEELEPNGASKRSGHAKRSLHVAASSVSWVQRAPLVPVEKLSMKPGS